MKHALFLAGISLSTLTFAGYGSVFSQAPTDVPSNHWAAKVTQYVISRGVMDAANGKFAGSRAVTRAELAISLARMAKLLERRDWATEIYPVGPEKNSAAWKAKPVTRYDLAAVLYRVGGYAMKGLPKNAKPHAPSPTLPAASEAEIKSPAGEAREAARYLARNRMLWKKSVLLKPDLTPVNADEVALAVSQMIAGVNARLSSEPQNKPDIGERPHSHS